MAGEDSTPRKYRPRSGLPEAKRPCSNCGADRDRKGQRYCRACHAAYMRANRPTLAEMSPEAYKKQIARAYTRVYIRRGKIEWNLCEMCGDPYSEVHHDDYSKPLHVRWLCRPCHLKHHAQVA